MDKYYYILFDTYEECLYVHEKLNLSNIENRIAPAPHDLNKIVCCGVSIMFNENDIDIVDKFLSNGKYKFKTIIKTERTLNSKRDRYC